MTATEGRLMKRSGQLLGLVFGIGLGVVATTYLERPEPAAAGSNDRFNDYVMATGAVSLTPNQQTDGVWLLDYKSGKLLGTVIDKNVGRIIGWAQVDLVSEFQVQPKQDVHFMMVTGWITAGQSALYVAETSTGKFGVYTMGPGVNGSGVVIRRHDLTTFRQAQPPAPGPVAPPKAGAPAPGPEIPPAGAAAPGPKLPPAEGAMPAPAPKLPPAGGAAPAPVIPPVGAPPAPGPVIPPAAEPPGKPGD